MGSWEHALKPVFMTMPSCLPACSYMSMHFEGKLTCAVVALPPSLLHAVMLPSSQPGSCVDLLPLLLDWDLDGAACPTTCTPQR